MAPIWHWVLQQMDALADEIIARIPKDWEKYVEKKKLPEIRKECFAAEVHLFVNQNLKSLRATMEKFGHYRHVSIDSRKSSV